MAYFTSNSKQTVVINTITVPLFLKPMSSSITLGDFITHAKQKKKKETEVKPSISVEHCIENEIFFEEQIKILHSRELSLFSSNPYLPAP